MANQLYRTLTGSSQKSGQTNSSLAPPTDLSKITTSNTQTGVLNHLTGQQEKLLDEFKERLQQDGWWSPDAVNGKATHDDGTLLYVLLRKARSSWWLTARQTIPTSSKVRRARRNRPVHRYREMDERAACRRAV